MNPASRFAVPLLLGLLAACGDSGGGGEDERKTAAGEVLGGSISDDMLPLDTVTSQSPPLRESANGDGPAAPAGSERGSANADEAEADAEAPAPEPAETPAETDG